ncbi:MAG: hypothetical protein ACTHNN_16540 [Xanthobacteraceae bacterium]
MFTKRKLACLSVIALVLVGCDDKSENQKLMENAALVTTCKPDISIYQWQDKLYFREQNSYKFRQVIANLDDVCTKFKPSELADVK